MLLSFTLAALPVIVPASVCSSSACPQADTMPQAVYQDGEKDSSEGSPTNPLFGDETKTLVRLTTSDRLHLAANYYPPRSRTKRAPAVILVHDAGKNRRSLLPLAQYLNKKGLATLVLDLRGHGESATEKLDWAKLDERGQTTQWAFAVRDLTAAAKFLRSQKGVHTANLTVIGMGAGSNLALRHALDDENVRATVLLNPPATALGFKLGPALTELGGLPCLIVSPKEGKAANCKLRDQCHEENDGLEYVELQNLKSKAKDMLDDKRLNNGVFTWLKDRILTKK